MYDAALKVGTAVVKAACSMWIGNPLAENAATTVVDLVQEQVTNRRERRALERRFAEIEDAIADRVVEQIGHEFRGLSENEREAAVLAVADSFTRAGLTDRVLFEQDLDPQYLAQYVRRKSRGMSRDLSEPGRALYDRVLADACAYVLTTFGALPRFQAGAFTELLRRQTLFLRELEEALARLPAHTAWEGEEDAVAAFHTAYRRKAAEKWDVLELFGTDAGTRRYPLSLAYLSLRVSGRHDERDLRLGEVMLSGDQRVEEVLGRHRRTFLRGPAGSGKTTLLRWLGVRAGRSDFPEVMREWHGLVPFLVPLREYVSEPLPEPTDFVRHTGRHLAEHAPRGWVTGLLESGRAIVLVDGIDELPAGRREDARRWLRTLLAEFPDCRYVVTTRPGAASEEWLGADGFVSAELQPLREKDVGAFVHHWHEAVRSGTVDTAERELLTTYERELTGKLTGQRHLRAIATTPLLCALLCALYRDQHTALPRDRMEVYDAALRMLLKDRDQQRGIVEGVDLSRQELVLLLQQLAKWLVVNGSSDAPVATAERQVARELAAMHRVEASSEEVFAHLLVRSGLLHSPTVDRVSFLHRTFEEYLAAEALVAEDSFPLLVKRAHDDQWHEVVVMAAGHASPAQREELVTGLLERSDQVKKHRDRLLLVAFACLETSPQLARALREEVEERVRAILPPRTKDHVHALTMVGEFALPLLARVPAKNASQSVKIIEAASKIGGPEAVPVIAGALRPPTERTFTAVSEAWERIQTREFAETVLPRAQELGYTSLVTPVESLPLVTEYMPGVKSLNIRGGPYAPESCPLPREVSDLAFFSFSPSSSWNVDALVRRLPELNLLRSVRFSYFAYATDISPLRESSISRLSLLSPQKVKNLEIVPQIPNLRELSLALREPDHAHSYLEQIAPLHNLEHLGFYSYGGDELTLLRNHPNALSTLHVGAPDTLASCAGVESQANTLTSLSISTGTGTTELTALRALPRLNELSLTLETAEANLSIITELPELKYLGLDFTDSLRVPDWIRDVPALTGLDLLGTGKVDLTALAGARDLTVTHFSERKSKIVGADLLGPGSTVRRG